MDNLDALVDAEVGGHTPLTDSVCASFMAATAGAAALLHP